MGHQINRGKVFFIATLTTAILISSSALSWALEANQQTWFNSVTDTLATVGRDQADKKDIIRLRKESRRQYRQQKQAFHQKSQTRKRIKKQQEAVTRKYQGHGHTVIGQ